MSCVLVNLTQTENLIHHSELVNRSEPINTAVVRLVNQHMETRTMRYNTEASLGLEGSPSNVNTLVLELLYSTPSNNILALDYK